VITRTTLKALWLAGGGVIATWLAVSPNHGVTTTPPTTTAPRPAASTEITAEEFNSQAEKIRSRTNAIKLQQSTRNLFRFNTPKNSGKAVAPDAAPAGGAVVDLPAPELPPTPVLTLSGVAERKTPEGPRRTAVISSDGQVYLAGVGDSVAGRFTVVTIDPEAVVLRDAEGTDLRLIMGP
jgi:hypothetical protein